MALDWSLLGPVPDIPGAVRQGMEYGRAQRIRGTQESAFGALAKDPNDASALAALAGTGSEGMQAAWAIQDRGRAQKQAELRRSIFSGGAQPAAFGPVGAPPASDMPVPAVAQPSAPVGPSAGPQIDREALQQYFIEDPAGARQIVESVKGLSAMHLEQFKVGAKLLDGVKDDAGYQQALAVGRSMGLDLSDVPPTYDPDYVERVTRVGRVLGGKSETGTNIQREVEYYRSIGRPELADQLLTRHAEGPPIAVRNTETNTVELYRPPSANPRPEPSAEAVEYLRQNPETKAQFDEMFGPGASDRVTGGPSPVGSGTFP